MSKKKYCQLEINSDDWFRARCKESGSCLLGKVPASKKADAIRACSEAENRSFICSPGDVDEQRDSDDGMPKDIENRPKELWDLPHYAHLPDKPFKIDLMSAVGEFLAHDIFDLDGNQPIEGKILSLTDGVVEVNPCQEALSFYEQRSDTFQMINVVVCCYGFEEKDGQLFGLPYHLSLRPAQKQGKPSCVEVGWIKNIDLGRVLEGNPHYMGFNPFSNAFGFYGIGGLPVNKDICSDTIGIVYNTFFLASNYDKNDVCDPGMCKSLLGESRSIINDYRKFRLSRYFKPFTNIDPIKIWGCDSPIELFLLQAMYHLKLKPRIQTYIFSDGTAFPTLQSMWEGGKKTKALGKTITEADFYFEEQKVAVFCDSIAYHSSDEEKAKDAAIDEKLQDIGINTIRISGTDIMNSPLECARRIHELVAYS